MSDFIHLGAEEILKERKKTSDDGFGRMSVKSLHKCEPFRHSSKKL